MNFQEAKNQILSNKAKTDVLSLGLTLIPFHSIYRLGKIFVEGLRYGKNNWKRGINDREYQEERLEHAFNHLFLWKEGDRSEDHLAKVMWFCTTQMELERMENEDSLPHSPSH
jgi:hypothetical protein